MENRSGNMPKDGQSEEESIQCKSKNRESAKSNSLSRRSVREQQEGRPLILNVWKQIGEIYGQKVVPQSICTFEHKLPKNIVSFDEKYVLRCLELIHNRALRTASRTGILSDSLCSTNICNKTTYDVPGVIVGCPSITGTDNVVISTGGGWFLGAITGSKSMMNILKSPLLQQLGPVDCDINLGSRSLLDAKGSVKSDCTSTPSELSISSLKKLEREKVTLGNHRYGPQPAHKRLVSVSSTNSTCSDQSSSSFSACNFLGMLQCTWKDGLPHYVFSIDDQREVYIAHSYKVEAPDDKKLDYVYTFHWRPVSKREHEIHEVEPDLIGKMKVSTSVALCPNNSKIKETQFVMYGSGELFMGETQTSNRHVKKHKGLTKKVINAFKTTQSHKQRSSSKLWGTNAILEDTSWEPIEDACSTHESAGINLNENDTPPNLELAAIILKDHIQVDNEEPEVGGWGMKFLKESVINQDTSPETSECCSRSSGECSTSIEVLVPAGIHGGPRTRSGGPSSLIERWSSGGHCDCGGWDMGCPLTILKPKLGRPEGVTQVDTSDECKTFDFFAQGSRQSSPIMKLTNIHDGLYYIHFQSSLSALQSFAISAATIHSHSPALQPKVYRS